jgi:hypothetical protein
MTPIRFSVAAGQIEKTALMRDSVTKLETDTLSLISSEGLPKSQGR